MYCVQVPQGGGVLGRQAVQSERKAGTLNRHRSVQWQLQAAKGSGRCVEKKGVLSRSVACRRSCTALGPQRKQSSEPHPQQQRPRQQVVQPAAVQQEPEDAKARHGLMLRQGACSRAGRHPRRPWWLWRPQGGQEERQQEESCRQQNLAEPPVPAQQQQGLSTASRSETASQQQRKPRRPVCCNAPSAAAWPGGCTHRRAWTK